MYPTINDNRENNSISVNFADISLGAVFETTDYLALLKVSKTQAVDLSDTADFISFTARSTVGGFKEINNITIELND